jgi:hypothetical protein
MDDRNSNSDEWKEDLGRAAIRFFSSLAAMVPLLGAALAFSVFFHGLFSGPMGFTCKSVPPDLPSKAMQRRLERRRIMPSPIAPEVRPVNPQPVEILRKEADQE